MEYNIILHIKFLCFQWVTTLVSHYTLEGILTTMLSIFVLKK